MFMWRRKISSFVINPRFQWSVTLYFLGLAFVSYFLTLSAVQFFFWKFKTAGEELGIPPESYYFTFLKSQEASMYLVFGCVGLVNLLAMLVGGIVLSHRIAGPLYRLRNHMDAVSSGKTDQDVVFRKKDFFPEIASGFNAVMSRIRNRKSA